MKILKKWNNFNESKDEFDDLYNAVNYSYAYYFVINNKIQEKYEDLDEALEDAIEYFNSETEFEFEERIDDLASSVVEYSDINDAIAKIKVFTGVDDIVEILNEYDLGKKGINPNNQSSWSDENQEI
jgi:hypothetical protein